MGDKSKISWTDATWNPVTGCTKVSAGCKNCYAERFFPRAYPDRRFTDVRLHSDRLDQPLRWRKPRRVFVNSMSDLFHVSVPDTFLDWVFGNMAIANCHVFQVLTKRADRMRAYMQSLEGRWRYVIQQSADRMEDVAPYHYNRFEPIDETTRVFPPSNVWLGVSAEDQPAWDERGSQLAATQAALRFVSCEPLLGPIDLWQSGVFGYRWLDWVIVGGESGPRYRPMSAAWARSLLDQCREAEIPFFFKQVSGPRPGMGESLLGRKIQEWPAAVQHGGME